MDLEMGTYAEVSGHTTTMHIPYRSRCADGCHDFAVRLLGFTILFTIIGYICVSGYIYGDILIYGNMFLHVRGSVIVWSVITAGGFIISIIMASYVPKKPKCAEYACDFANYMCGVTLLFVVTAYILVSGYVYAFILTHGGIIPLHDSLVALFVFSCIGALLGFVAALINCCM
jgi:hypothetical protein